MKLLLPIACLCFAASSFIFAQATTARSIDDLIAEASHQTNFREWKELRGFESWKVQRFVERTRFFDHTVRFGFQTTDDREFSIIVESAGNWPDATSGKSLIRFFVEFENKFYPFLPSSAEARDVFRVLSSTPKHPRLKEIRRFEHEQSLLNALGP